ncbi:MAG TPA: hypothetical protein DD001_16020 [Microcoleaceae bacterium UBA10368]|nr:hypothetical protein [Microcoleaceae cyanobacterium UBA10368]
MRAIGLIESLCIFGRTDCATITCLVFLLDISNIAVLEKVSYALSPMPYALCPMPYALCPMPNITSSF